MMFVIGKKLDKEFTKRIEYELDYFYKKYVEADSDTKDNAKRSLFDYIEDAEIECREKGEDYREWFIMRVSRKIRSGK